MFGDHQISKAEERTPLLGVLGQFAIARRPVSKNFLDDVKRMLNLSSNTAPARLELLAQLSCFRTGQRTAPTGVQSSVRLHRADLIP
jgi:hypothetical protein